jgi:teichuronic acid biosynthesis glycosyltransferase TuaC
MRVLVVSHMFASTLNPDDVFIYNQVKALADQGVEVRVLQPVPWVPWLLRWRKKWRDYYLISKEGPWGGVETARVVYPNPPTALLQSLASVGLVVPLLLAMVRARRTFDFQIVHAHTLTPDGFASVIAGHILKLPVVVSARGSDVHTYPHENALAKKSARFVLTHCARVIAVSEKLASQAVELVKRDDPIEVVYNGVDAKLFTPCADKKKARASLGVTSSGTVALTVGALIREKGIEELISAFERIGGEYPDFRLIAVGGGPMRGKLEDLGKRMRGGDRVILPGVVPNQRVAEYMRAADILIHPSHAEGLPNAVLEAMATGLPVIATTVGGIPEVVIHGETGLLIGAKDVKALESQLRTVLNDREMALQMGRAGRDRVVARHTWDSNAREHIRIYQNILEKR